MGTAYLLRDLAKYVKVSNAIYSRPDLMQLLHDWGYKIFYDPKHYDTNDRVLCDISLESTQGVDFVTVHASGSQEMHEKALSAAKQGETEVFAVTIPTDFTEDDCKAVYGCKIDTAVRRLTNRALNDGIKNFISPTKYIKFIREQAGDNAIIITPGIRLPDGEANAGQKMTGTAREAIAFGADYVVGGSAIYKAKDLIAAFKAMADDIRPVNYDILRYLRLHGGIIGGDCLIGLTSGLVSNGYINQRILKDMDEKYEYVHHEFLAWLGWLIAEKAREAGATMVFGPATMGAIFASYAHLFGGIEYSSIDLKVEKPELTNSLAGHKVLVVDDTLTTGGSIAKCVDIVRQESTAKLVGALVTVRRDKKIRGKDCGLKRDERLIVLTDVDFDIVTEQPDENGWCPLFDSGLKVTSKVGHPEKLRWLESHPDLLK